MVGPMSVNGAARSMRRVGGSAHAPPARPVIESWHLVGVAACCVIAGSTRGIDVLKIERIHRFVRGFEGAALPWPSWTAAGALSLGRRRCPDRLRNARNGIVSRNPAARREAARQGADRKIRL